MGFNCAQEKAKFDREWLRLRKEYTDAGMSETAIQKIYEYDWYCFCRNRAYERRATQMPSLEIDSPDDERRSALFRKNEALSTSFDESAFPDRYAWVDTLEDERLLRAIMKLNKKDLELLTYVTLEGHGQEELARRWGCTQAAVAIRMKKIKKMILAGIALSTLFAISGCGTSKDEVNSIKVGYFNNVTHAQALLMKSEKSLENTFGKDINVKWTAFNAGPAEVEALFAGDIDIGYIGPVPAISANVKSNGDVQILSGAAKGGAILIRREGAQISGVKDLAGKTVAIPQIGNTQHLSLLKLLEDSGLKPVTEGGNVTVSAVANADVANAMARGDVDAALVPEPWGATLLEQGAKMVLNYDEIYLKGQYDVAVVVVRKEFMEKNPDLVEKFLREHEAATKEIYEKPQQVQKKINAELKQTTGKSLGENIIADAFDRILFQTDYRKEAIQGFANISKEQGFIKELPVDSQLYAVRKEEEKR